MYNAMYRLSPIYDTFDRINQGLKYAIAEFPVSGIDYDPEAETAADDLAEIQKTFDMYLNNFFELG